jgi:hypothetical protein
MTRLLFSTAVAALMLTGCATPPGPAASASPAPFDIPAQWPSTEQAITSLTNAYLRLTLEAGTHEAEYVDAYYGPAELRERAIARPRSLAALEGEAQAMVLVIDNLLQRPDLAARTPEPDYSDRRRLLALRGMLVAAETRLKMIGGERFRFADEARGQFGVEVTTRPLSDFDAILARLETLIPGDGPLAARVDAFNERYVIPADRLRPVFDAAIAECRRRTMAHMTLPEGESFTMAFVTNKPWSGYNYYLGNYQSRIEINTDLPIRISRAVDLGCHEGYPGHHVLNLMVESRMARGGATANGQPGTPWIEYTVNPLYSPTSVLSEGSANYGIDLAFPGPERLAFERDVLYPLAGLDPATAEAFWRVQQATEALGGARLTIARMYLDGEINRAQAVELTQRYLLLSPARAEQSVGFTDHYRSYVLNYGWGKDLVRQYIERGQPDEATRWRRMEHILSEPTLPTDLMPR